MAKNDNAAPVIIKRKTVIEGGGHHGGAWKVAYADFVTAMMAFFLLMWLLNATTEKQRKGIADYFNPTIPINRISGGGDGAFGGDSMFSEDKLSQTGTGAVFRNASPKHQSSGAEDGAQTGEELRAVANEIDRTLSGFGGESMASDRLARRIVTRVTDEGLIVEFFDLKDEPLFAPDSADPEPVMEEIAKMVIRVFAIVDNQVAINGYVRSYPEVLRVDPVWDLSAKRAQKVRELLESEGFDRKRVQRVTGYADRKPAAQAPMSVRNNRIEVILLRRDR
ncbi:flagellar motor protein MotB [Paenirhodobacter sp.]|uniref:flagellar motor protein MotB n=1 Tax=Paenirhodobacter sp. TaxID=1965326 RepID=UPI003B3F36BE